MNVFSQHSEFWTAFVPSSNMLRYPDTFAVKTIIFDQMS